MGRARFGAGLPWDGTTTPQRPDVTQSLPWGGNKRPPLPWYGIFDSNWLADRPHLPWDDTGPTVQAIWYGGWDSNPQALTGSRV
jgi:hypothetical protein